MAVRVQGNCKHTSTNKTKQYNTIDLWYRTSSLSTQSSEVHYHYTPRWRWSSGIRPTKHCVQRTCLRSLYLLANCLGRGSNPYSLRYIQSAITIWPQCHTKQVYTCRSTSSVCCKRVLCLTISYITCYVRLCYFRFWPICRPNRCDLKRHFAIILSNCRWNMHP